MNEVIKTIANQDTELARRLAKRSQDGSDTGLFVSASLHSNSGTAKARIISNVVPYLFEGHLLISLKSGWISVFGKIPSFDVMIDDMGRLVIASQEACLK